MATEHVFSWREAKRSNRYLLLSGFFGAVAGFSLLLLAGHLRGQVESVYMFHQFVSSLGWGSNGAAELFTFGLTLLGGMLLVFQRAFSDWVMSYSNFRTERRAGLHLSKGEAHWRRAVIGLWILAWYVDIRVPDINVAFLLVALHCVGAALFFYGAIRGAIEFNRAMAVNLLPTKVPEFIAKQSAALGVFMCVGVVPMFAMAYTEGVFDHVAFQREELWIAVPERLALVSDISAGFPLVALLEWGLVFSLSAWVVVVSLRAFRAA